MTTIAELLAETQLTDLELVLKPNEFWDRHILMTVKFLDWFDTVLPMMERVNDAVMSPYEQIGARFKQFIRGDSFEQPRQLDLIRHRVKFVWEIKTADIRIFGAFAEIDKFIAVRGMATDKVKGPPPLYSGLAGEVEREIMSLGLTEAQLICTGDIRNVISNAN